METGPGVRFVKTGISYPCDTPHCAREGTPVYTLQNDDATRSSIPITAFERDWCLGLQEGKLMNYTPLGCGLDTNPFTKVEP